jgi:hypothetical protein
MAMQEYVKRRDAMTRQCSIVLIITILLAHICYGNTIDGTPDIIFGSGNNNGHFTFDQSGGVELGLRAKVPYTDELNADKRVSYFYSTGQTWKFDRLVNADSNGSFTLQINDLTHLPSIDCDPSLETNFLAFDPITSTEEVSFLHQTIGNNKTQNDRSEKATNADNLISHRQTRKKLTFNIRRLSNFPTIIGWVLFLRMRF